ncbi:MAG: rRNA maturation RNase YbeY [Methylicorpusculum sp.]|uniref:rRNA maturation RNase YbeY n=1 Tax=Methylicorpusculum sp. TaxID=2713644 RepID=UPI002723C997|nr:rRNA maturation RNase YbeY [Methylicorpusculum sp.]MDO8940140.1 rRNA maturation RNase YbeY [Methylicorpusculum sp.]MDO9241394.1 rRNA maturation RNase YbeY [Methylicorpusculum sp.]MDP2204488.1 rRNA maturation RNase YbeY [Methylicorpusculum sp.]
MNHIEIQWMVDPSGLPGDELIHQWVEEALDGYAHDAELVVRVVDKEESAELNEQYRHKNGSTNVLSFPFEVPEGVSLEVNLLGDLVVCAPVLAEEATEQNKLLNDHWAHIIVHGVLHLLGFDHIDEIEAEAMESHEIAILARLNIQNPYNEVCES